MKKLSEVEFSNLRQELQKKPNADYDYCLSCQSEIGLNNLISETISSKPAVIEEEFNKITKDQIVADLERVLVDSPQRVTLLSLNYKDKIKVSYPYPYYHNGNLTVQEIPDLTEFENSKTQAN